MASETPYNPLDKRNLGESVADALLSKDPVPLDGLSPFQGAGIYAIYYTGSFPAYREIARRNQNGKFRLPIYVGRAIPPGSSKGSFGLDYDPGRALHKRLREHADSIADAAGSLKLVDFQVRYLIVEDIWIPLGENLLIAHFQPAWNLLLDGFGNHDPGSGRYRGERPSWDTIHPGRAWAEKCKANAKSKAQILSEFEARLAEALKSVSVPT